MAFSTQIEECGVNSEPNLDHVCPAVLERFSRASLFLPWSTRQCLKRRWLVAPKAPRKSQSSGAGMWPRTGQARPGHPKARRTRKKGAQNPQPHKQRSTEVHIKCVFVQCFQGEFWGCGLGTSRKNRPSRHQKGGDGHIQPPQQNKRTKGVHRKRGCPSAERGELFGVPSASDWCFAAIVGLLRVSFH